MCPPCPSTLKFGGARAHPDYMAPTPMVLGNWRRPFDHTCTVHCVSEASSDILGTMRRWNEKWSMLRLNLIWIGVLYRPCGAIISEISQFRPNFNILPIPLPIWAKFGEIEGLCLHANLHSDPFDPGFLFAPSDSFLLGRTVLPQYLPWTKDHNFEHFWHYEGSCSIPFTEECQMWYTVDQCAKFRLNWFILSFSSGENP